MSTSSTSSLREEILDLMIDLRPHLPTSAYPNIPKLTTIFTQTLSSGAFPRHRVAILPGDRKGKYLLRLLDRSLYQKLIGRSITITPPKMRGRRNTDIKVFIDAYKPEQNSRSKIKEINVSVMRSSSNTIRRRNYSIWGVAAVQYLNEFSY